MSKGLKKARELHADFAALEVIVQTIQWEEKINIPMSNAAGVVVDAVLV